MNPTPTVTIVIPTAGRVALTRASLESIQKASAADGVQVEVVVVDSSPPLEHAELRAICTQLGAALLPGPRSVSAKRNLGAEHASTHRVMFMDSDCVIEPGCLAAHLARLGDPTVHASQGTILFRGVERLAFRAVRCSGILNAFVPASGQPIRSAASGNLMVRRTSFLDVQFDPRLGPPGLGGEDVDFGFRLANHGFNIIGTPAAIVYHETTTWNAALANVRRFFSWGRAEAHLIERHPRMSYFDMPSAVLMTVLLGVASVTVAVFVPVALVALLLGILSYAVFMAVAGARHHPEDRVGGALGHWVFFVLDVGRIVESFRLGRPGTALRRLWFAEDQVTQEWRDLVPTAWAVWFMALVGNAFIWWAVR